APHNITKFAEDFPGGRSLDLNVNYRSDPVLVWLFRVAGRALDLEGASPSDWQVSLPAIPLPRVWRANAANGEAEEWGLAVEVLRLLRQAREAEQEFPAVLSRVAAGIGAWDLSPVAVSACTALANAIAVVEAETEPWQFLARYLFGHGAVVRRLLADGRPVAV